ncbi:Aip5p KNAG_0C02110 [Huiozyma naganishii CBS 8797]|uniref:Uncharacterized protein n=1 Tax=Huiozyma naganishii (strain ATCC MYA-139 / BCRC 22969 / CBS 8797 / KCTC 17520 / NBRC 10181 / NCYC 3082 / Yp74L-3) TaxID=1071383 RepID=J7RWE3_HUIN7|nr:hypothetical protein KNAG_0C02110 [Kazachstania naganishii CBS 8797]CCK69322.1 hypothetical protein KNAG_0C02110 [Kazachstania naganishii CBS 8797]
MDTVSSEISKNSPGTLDLEALINATDSVTAEFLNSRAKNQKSKKKGKKMKKKKKTKENLEESVTATGDEIPNEKTKESTSTVVESLIPNTNDNENKKIQKTSAIVNLNSLLKESADKPVKVNLVETDSHKNDNGHDLESSDTIENPKTLGNDQSGVMVKEANPAIVENDRKVDDREIVLDPTTPSDTAQKGNSEQNPTVKDDPVIFSNKTNTADATTEKNSMESKVDFGSNAENAKDTSNIATSSKTKDSSSVEPNCEQEKLSPTTLNIPNKEAASLETQDLSRSATLKESKLESVTAADLPKQGSTEKIIDSSTDLAAKSRISTLRKKGLSKSPVIKDFAFNLQQATTGEKKLIDSAQIVHNDDSNTTPNEPKGTASEELAEKTQHPSPKPHDIEELDPEQNSSTGKDNDLSDSIDKSKEKGIRNQPQLAEKVFSEIKKTNIEWKHGSDESESGNMVNDASKDDVKFENTDEQEEVINAEKKDENLTKKAREVETDFVTTKPSTTMTKANVGALDISSKLDTNVQKSKLPEGQKEQCIDKERDNIIEEDENDTKKKVKEGVSEGNKDGTVKKENHDVTEKIDNITNNDEAESIIEESKDSTKKKEMENVTEEDKSGMKEKEIDGAAEKDKGDAIERETEDVTAKNKNDITKKAIESVTEEEDDQKATINVSEIDSQNDDTKESGGSDIVASDNKVSDSEKKISQREDATGESSQTPDKAFTTEENVSQGTEPVLTVTDENSITDDPELEKNATEQAHNEIMPLDTTGDATSEKDVETSRKDTESEPTSSDTTLPLDKEVIDDEKRTKERASEKPKLDNVHPTTGKDVEEANSTELKSVDAKSESIPQESDTATQDLKDDETQELSLGDSPPEMETKPATKSNTKSTLDELFAETDAFLKELEMVDDSELNALAQSLDKEDKPRSGNPQTPVAEPSPTVIKQSDITAMLSKEPVYIYTSLAGGGFHMIPRTNRLATILTANKVEFTYRDLGTDDEARKVWKTYSRGRLLPAVVRGRDDIIGNWEEIEDLNEEYKVREAIYSTL